MDTVCTMNVFRFTKDSVKDLKEGEVFLFYEKNERGWSPEPKLWIYQGQGLSFSDNVLLLFNSADQSHNMGANLESLAGAVAVKLLSFQHPEVVKNGLGYEFLV